MKFRSADEIMLEQRLSASRGYQERKKKNYIFLKIYKAFCKVYFVECVTPLPANYTKDNKILVNKTLV